MGPKRLAAILRDMANKIDNSAQPSRSLIARDLTRLMASLRMAASYGNTPEIEQALYGHSGGETDPDKQGSSIWWLVFNEIGVEDWTPVTDFNAIEQKAKALIAEWSKAWGSGATPPWDHSDPKVQAEVAKDTQRLLGELKENWTDYQQNYMPEHVKILKEKGLM
jgi:hypothetical protein